MSKPSDIPAPQLPAFSEKERVERAKRIYETICARRSLRDFSPQTVPREVIEYCVAAAGTAPNGANLQPWHFCVISDPDIKQQIRLGAEKEEREFYHGRAPDDWLDALNSLGTDEHKPFLEIAPYLIVVFAEAHRFDETGNRKKNYYVSESVGIATGFLINALHACGLATLTHTPSPMKFLNRILKRPENERPFLILVVGHPTENATVPNIQKKSLEDLASFF